MFSSSSMQASPTYDGFDRFDEAGFDRSLAIILKGPYFPMQALLPVFVNPARESSPHFTGSHVIG